MPADWNFLRDWFNRQDQSLEQPDLPDADCESSPVVFPDNETSVKLVFSATLPQFTQMLSALEKGAILSYPNEWHNVWWNFVKNWECQVTICDEVALCLTNEDPAVVEALAQLLATNPTIIQAIVAANAEAGGGTPGQPLTDDQADQDLTPENVKPDDECDYDALWGACLYLVQSGNRAITDFFEVLESASNTLEASAIIAQNIPAAGSYVASAAEFADQLQETIAEGYAAAYTEEYEEQLACLLFCLARANDCTLNMDDMVQSLSDRLSVPELLVDFGLLMNFVAAGSWAGEDIANVAFLVFFGALRFGQQFADTIGIRPMTVLMSLGADQLASDNWMVLCECPDIGTWTFPTDDPFEDWTLLPFAGNTCVIVDDHVEAVEDAPPSNNMYSNFELAVDGHITRIDVHFTTDVDVDGTYEYRLYIDDDLQEAETFIDDGNYVLSWSGNLTGSHTYRLLTGARGDPADGNFIWTTEVTFFWQDENPFA